MLNRANIANVIAALKATYPNYTPSDPTKTAEMFLAILGDLEPDALNTAVLSLAASGREFAPSAGQIRQEAIRLNACAAGIPEDWKAYEEVVNMPAGMIKRRVIEPEGGNGWATIEETQLRFSHPLVESVARMIGWPNSFPTDEPGVDRSQFIRAYKAEVERAMQNSSRPRMIQEYIDAKSLETRGTIPALAQVTRQLEAHHAG